MKTQTIRITALFLGSFIAFTACKKEVSPTQNNYQTNVQIHISHRVGGLSLIYDSLLYKNTANNQYLITLLEYYISDISLKKDDNTFVKCNGTYYVNPKMNLVNISLSNIPPGNYLGIKFLIGIPPERNIQNQLEPTTENNNMQWPEPLGGGYHFFKMEGRYLDSTNKQMGFAMHLGSNEMIIEHQFIPMNLKIDEQSICYSNMVMEVNEWFCNPYTYNFEKDGNYTMAIKPLMTILKNNAYDVFSKPE